MLFVCEGEVNANVDADADDFSGRWISDKKLAGLPPKKKYLNSTWTPGVDLESTWNMWGSVKSSISVSQLTTSFIKPGQRIAVITHRVTRATVPFPTPAQLAMACKPEAMPSCPN